MLPAIFRSVRKSGRGKNRMNSQDYGVDILRLSDSEGGGFTAIVLELPGCRSDRDTPQAPLESIYDAIACWIEAAQELGRTVPRPRRIAA
jgi:antitoxin HicB